MALIPKWQGERSQIKDFNFHLKKTEKKKKAQCKHKKGNHRELKSMK